jgi:hypothetical protein
MATHLKYLAWLFGRTGLDSLFGIVFEWTRKQMELC